jgi:hypothetical protein
MLVCLTPLLLPSSTDYGFVSTSKMPLHKKRIKPENKICFPEPLYNDTSGLLKTGQDPLRWDENFQMFTLQNFLVNVHDQDQLQIFNNIWKSKLHRLAACPPVLPCADAVSWIVEHVDLQNRCILTVIGEPIASFQGSDLASYYHLKKGLQQLDRDLLTKFPYKGDDLFRLWCKPDVVLKHIRSANYPTTDLKTPYQYIVALLCRLYGKKNASTFTFSLMPLIYYCTNEGIEFNWSDILSRNLAAAIAFVKHTSPKQFPEFHMCSYLLDIMCVSNRYPKMCWAWQPTNPSIHIYCKVLWEHRYRTEYDHICNHFFAPLYESIFCAPAPCMANKALSILQNIGDWYLLEHGTYIRVYGATKAPHLLPRFVPDKLVLQELAYQTIVHRVGAALCRNKKDIWPSLPLSIGSYYFATLEQAEDEVNTLLSYGFGEECFRRHDPKKVVREHCIQNKYTWQYTSIFWKDEEPHCGARTYDQVIARRQGQPSSSKLLLQSSP